jgi:hypothetical protein
MSSKDDKESPARPPDMSFASRHAVAVAANMVTASHAMQKPMTALT